MVALHGYGVFARDVRGCQGLTKKGFHRDWWLKLRSQRQPIYEAKQLRDHVLPAVLVNVFEPPEAVDGRAWNPYATADGGCALSFDEPAPRRDVVSCSASAFAEIGARAPIAWGGRLRGRRFDRGR